MSVTPQKPATEPGKHESRVFDLESKLDTERRLRKFTNLIHSMSLDEILLKAREDIQRIMDCERVTIYVADPGKNEIYSKVKDGDEVKEIRLPIGSTSIAGYVALKKKGLRLTDAYDAGETLSIDPNLRFDAAWDKKTGFKTTQVIGMPILKEGRLCGVIQVINTRSGAPFSENQTDILEEIGETLAIAFQNQQKINTRTSPYDYLLKNDIITPEQLETAQQTSQAEGYSTEHILITKYQIEKPQIAKSLSEYYRCDFVPYSPEIEVPKDLLQPFTLDYLKHHQCAPLSREDTKVYFVMVNPRDIQTVGELEKVFSKEKLSVRTKVSTREDILELIDRLFGQTRQGDAPAAAPVSGNELLSRLRAEADQLKPKTEPSKKDVEQIKEDDAAMIQLVNKIITDAHAQGASDIHIEPYMDGDVHVRVRVDGICSDLKGDLSRIPAEFRRNIVARIKIMANLDIAERRRPQDGKIRFKNFGPIDIELRVATVPTTGEIEDAVMRILSASKPIPLPDIAMTPENYARFERIIQEPYGIILCVGPTGSGKTTTLHSALGYVNKPDVKIWTAEDPVEITQQGLRQVQVHPKAGFTFETALRSFLRCDPDIIMIGEMRDYETAEAAIEASLTGHLVFSTLHTNNAPETITRLLDMEIDPYSFGDSLLAVLAQRLVRRVCKTCKESYKPSREEFDKLRHEFGNDALFDKLISSDSATLARARGCEKCNKTGYKGRMGLHELMVVGDEIKQMIYRKALSSSIRESAVKDGMIFLKQDGIRKCFAGLTDFAEVRSVCIK